MNGWWWLVIVLAVLGALLLVVGFLQMRAARPEPGIVGGFGGPPGSSDVGGQPGFEAPDPRAHWKVGAPLRIAGFVAVSAAIVLAVVLLIARAF